MHYAPQYMCIHRDTHREVQQGGMLAIHSRYHLCYPQCLLVSGDWSCFLLSGWFPLLEAFLLITKLIFRFSGKLVRSTHQVTRAQLPACVLGPCSLICKRSSPGRAGEEDRAMAPTSLVKLSPGNYKGPIYSLAMTDSLQEFNTPSIKNVLAWKFSV